MTLSPDSASTSIPFGTRAEKLSAAKRLTVSASLESRTGMLLQVFEAHAEEIFEEAENRLHAQKAVMVKLMEH